MLGFKELYMIGTLDDFDIYIYTYFILNLKELLKLL